MKKKASKRTNTFLEQFRHLRKYLIVAGIKMDVQKVYLLLYFVAGGIDLAFLIFFYVMMIKFQVIWYYYFIITMIMFTLGYVLIFLLLWLFFLFALDYLKFKRRTTLEEVLPEFLRLVSANHRAGLPLDTSLWKANRPRFGILSEEINEVAKKTYATGDLTEPLREFSTKYDSSLLRRVISNMNEGLRTGVDIAALLDDISMNITTIRNTRKELASEVENYMLFITVTVLIISPLMFALTQKMSGLIETVRGTITESMSGASASQMPFQFDAVESKREFTYYFDLFVYLMVGTNSIISVLLMSIVKYGNVKQDLKKIPIFYIIAISVYLIMKVAFKNFLVF
ncbi:type II secretion system F family protein [Candidatus Woesearchaeota archaeon]|nr:type II secretion system F family protein [Candidatus Woesearchaeota archaeon]